MRLIVRWLATSLALYLTVRWVPGLHPSGPLHWVLASALALGLLNALARPVVCLLRAVTKPLSCLTFGLWTLLLSLFINGLVFYAVGSLEWGFRVDGFPAAVLGALVMSVVNAVLTGVLEMCWGDRSR